MSRAHRAVLALTRVRVRVSNPSPNPSWPRHPHGRASLPKTGAENPQRRVSEDVVLDDRDRGCGGWAEQRATPGGAQASPAALEKSERGGIKSGRLSTIANI